MVWPQPVRSIQADENGLWIADYSRPEQRSKTTRTHHDGDRRACQDLMGTRDGCHGVSLDVRWLDNSLFLFTAPEFLLLFFAVWGPGPHRL